MQADWISVWISSCTDVTKKVVGGCITPTSEWYLKNDDFSNQLRVYDGKRA